MGGRGSPATAVMQQPNGPPQSSTESSSRTVDDERPLSNKCNRRHTEGRYKEDGDRISPDIDSDRSINSPKRRQLSRECDQGEMSRNIGSIGLNLPSFEGNIDGDIYLAWVRQTENVFKCWKPEERAKVLLAATSFSKQASVWWALRQRGMEKSTPIETWDALKDAMKKRFMPPDYLLNTRKQFYRLKQGNLSVTEYFTKLETLLVNGDLQQRENEFVGRFVEGLNPELRESVELNPLEETNEVLHRAIKLEKQQQKKSFRASRQISN